jgi:large conductance mechanosensitive channel
MTYSVNGSIFMVGAFVSALISFLTIVVVIFFLVVKPVSKMKEISSKKEKKGATTKQCPECLSIIPVGARRCAFCTSKVK